jgi:ubiquinone/menaquinone biosynthesis C-methylase UbiE
MAVKPNFTKKRKRKVHGATFWDTEYTNPSHLKLSTVESGDLAKFTRWIERQGNELVLPKHASAIDAGCGNGRNLIYLAKEFGMKGVGVDISSAAIAQARRASTDFSITYHVGSAGSPLSAPDESQALALDMMTSHFLNKEERTNLRDELHRVLIPGGFLFMKTFLKDEDLHTARLLKDFPGPEVGSYIHPVMGVAEYVYSEEELVAFLSEKFIIRKIYRSHRHAAKGGAGKRRTISIYAEKDYGRVRG